MNVDLNESEVSLLVAALDTWRNRVPEHNERCKALQRRLRGIETTSDEVIMFIQHFCRLCGRELVDRKYYCDSCTHSEAH